MAVWLNDDGEGFDLGSASRIKSIPASVRESPIMRPKSTGTTIVGLMFAGGVVLASDTRSTMDTVVAEKTCNKVHYLAPNIYSVGAGTSADTNHVTQMVAAKLALYRWEHDGNLSRVSAARTLLSKHLFRYMGYVSAALIVGGVDAHGPYLCSVSPNGYSRKDPFVADGSGSLAAKQVLERGFGDALTREQAVALAIAAISAGITHDLGSGSNVDVVVIARAPPPAGSAPGALGPVKTEIMRSIHTPPSSAVAQPPPAVTAPPGTTPLLGTPETSVTRIPLPVRPTFVVVEETRRGHDDMTA